MLSSKAAPSLAIGIISNQPPPNYRHHHRCSRNNRSLIDENHVSAKSNDCSNNDIEIEWKETTTKRHRQVRFDPTLDWKSETEKAEHGHLRRLAEKEIKKRLDFQKQQLVRMGNYMEWHLRFQAELRLSRSDRQKEVFCYIVFCNVDLLVEQYRNSDSFLLARMFDRLFEDAIVSDHPRESDSWLRESFSALQLEYRRIYENNQGSHSGSPQLLFAGLSRSTDQALFFIHWLSPAFRLEEKDSKQRQVHSCILGDIDRFEEYLFGDVDITEGKKEEIRKDLCLQLCRFFRTVHPPLPASAESSASLDTDLRAYFAAIRELRDHVKNRSSCHWTSCCDDPQQETQHHQLFVYESLTYESKQILFCISAMPAFCSYIAARSTAQQVATRCGDKDFSSLLPSSFLGFSPEDCNASPCGTLEVQNDPKPTDKDAQHQHCDPCCTSTTLLSSHDEYEFTNELCNLICEGV